MVACRRVADKSWTQQKRCRIRIQLHFCYTFRLRLYERPELPMITWFQRCKELAKQLCGQKEPEPQSAMDAALSPPSSSHSPLSSSRPTTTRSGLTLVLPSLKNLKAAKADKKTTQAAHIPQSPAIDVEGQEKKAPRPVKLKPLKEVLVKLIQQIKKYAFHIAGARITLKPLF